MKDMTNKENNNFEKLKSSLSFTSVSSSKATDGYDSWEKVRMFGTLIYGLKNGYIVEDQEETTKNVFTFSLGKNSDKKYRCTIPTDDKIYDIVKNHLEKLSVADDNIMLSTFNKLMDANLTDDEYMQLYIGAIESASRLSRMDSPRFILPNEISKLVCELLSEGCKKILNPFEEIAPCSFNIGDGVDYTGLYSDKTTLEIGKIGVAIAGAKSNFNFKLRESDDFNDYRADEKFDAILVMPPITSNGTTMDFDFDFLKSHANDDGKLIMCLPVSVLSSYRYSKMRENNTPNLESIILLSNIFFTSIFLTWSIVIFNKKNDNYTKIRMYDASACRNRHSILDLYRNTNSKEAFSFTFDRMEENNWSWYLNDYFEKTGITFPDGYETKKFGDIATLVEGEKCDVTKGRLVCVSNLARNFVEYEKSPESFEETHIDNHGLSLRKITRPVILMSNINDLRPTYCKATDGNPIFVKNHHVFAYAINKEFSDKIDIGYLCKQLSEIPNTYGSSIFRNPWYYEKLVVGFPPLNEKGSLDEQKRIFDTAKKAYLLAKSEEADVKEALEQQKKEIIDEFRIRKHDFGSYMSELADISTLIEKRIQKATNLIDLKEDLSDLTKNLKDVLSKTIELNKHFCDEEWFGIAEQLDLDKYFINMKHAYNNKLSGFEMDYVFDTTSFMTMSENYIKSPIVMMAKSDMEKICTNIISNAKLHGFTDKSRHDYKISIRLSVDFDRKMYRVDFCNNGKPMPKGMNKEQYGSKGIKAGYTGNTGFGGNIIKSVLQHYNGDYELSSNEEETIIEVFLPLFIN